MHMQFSEGDLLAVPLNNTNTFPVDPYKLSLIERIELQPVPWLATVKREAGAGFYSDRYGPLPFAFNEIAPEKYYVFVVSKPPQ